MVRTFFSPETWDASHADSDAEGEDAEGEEHRRARALVFCGRGLEQGNVK